MSDALWYFIGGLAVGWILRTAFDKLFEWLD